MATPKVLINLIRSIDITIELVILNTRVEVNVMLYKLTKSLRCLILSTKKLKLRTVSS